MLIRICVIILYNLFTYLLSSIYFLMRCHYNVCQMCVCVCECIHRAWMTQELGKDPAMGDFNVKEENYILCDRIRLNKLNTDHLFLAPNDIAYKRRIVTAVKNCCANCVETSRPQQREPNLLFFGQADHADPLYGWRCSS